MSDDEGFVRVSRAVIRSFADDPAARAVYYELCERAEYFQARTRMTDRGSVHLEVGDCYLGRAKLAERIGRTEKVTRAALGRLAKGGVIDVQTSNRGTVVSVLYLREKGRLATAQGPADGQQAASRGPAEGQTSATTKNEDPDLDRDRPDDRLDLRREPSDPDQRGGGDRDHARARDALVRRFAELHAEAYNRVADAIGSPVPRMHPCDPENALRELVGLPLLEGTDERLQHVLDVRGAEAVRTSTVKFFGVGIWKREAFERAVTMNVGEHRRAPTAVEVSHAIHKRLVREESSGLPADDNWLAESATAQICPDLPDDLKSTFLVADQRRAARASSKVLLDEAEPQEHSSR